MAWTCASCGWVNEGYGRSTRLRCANCKSRPGEIRDVSVIIETKLDSDRDSRPKPRESSLRDS